MRGTFVAVAVSIAGAALILSGAVAPRLVAQGRSVTVQVQGPAGRPVPHAVVQLRGAESRITDDSGRVGIRLSVDSARVTVRRMGYHPFEGILRPPASGFTTIVLDPLPQQLAAVSVLEAPARTPLERTGFYDRMLRAQRGAFNADFITPEEFTSRMGSRLTDVLFGRRFVFPQRTAGASRQMYLRGRGGCLMTVYLDGQVVRPEPVRDRGPDARGGLAIGPGPTRIVPIDEIVDVSAIAAVEVYASAAQAPAELIPLVGSAQEGTCGIVAIWTGARR